MLSFRIFSLEFFTLLSPLTVYSEFPFASSCFSMQISSAAIVRLRKVLKKKRRKEEREKRIVGPKMTRVEEKVLTVSWAILMFNEIQLNLMLFCMISLKAWEEEMLKCKKKRKIVMLFKQKRKRHLDDVMKFYKRGVVFFSQLVMIEVMA